MKPYFLAALVALIAASSCSTPKDIIYFQDISNEQTYSGYQQTIAIKPADRLSILVHSRDQQLVDLFNLPYSPRILGTSSNNYTRSTNQGISTYTVSPEGKIDFPLLGEVKVGGMTRLEIAGLIKGMLISKDYVRDPVVTVELTNGIVSVLGEVSHPGSYSIDRDDMTILDALGLAGDLTIYGRREDVKLIRSNGDSQETYVVSLLDAQKLRSSPAYFIQQDDVIYVDPNDTRIRQSTINGNTVLTPSFWISLASLATTITALCIR
ncbi:MAG: polysaccharide biosynthesis/export family protein [Bacteroides sp.]|nr:polysaccharide biosynthesis/export family protein [Bacteroides sp.]